MSRTVVRIRVEVEVEVSLDGSYEFGPGLDNVVLPKVIGATLEKDGKRLGEVELGDVLVLDSWEESDDADNRI